MASYRPKIKIDSAGNTQDLPLDAETLKGKNVDYFATSQNLTNLQNVVNGKQDTLIAGANIEIQGTTISSKLTPATANVIGGIKVGDGLKVDSTGLLSVNFATSEEVQAMFKGGI